MRLPIRLLLITASIAASRVGDAWLAARRARVAARAGRWAAVLANYSAVQRAERAKGADARYVVAFADNYGLGNRIATVTSALALAVASRRALIVLWPRGRMHGRPDYDPAGVVDLFAPTLVDWSTPPDAQRAVRRCAEDVAKRPGRKGTKRWAIGDPHDAKTAGALRAFDYSTNDWRPRDRVLCAYGYYYWGWALTCNAALGGGDVLADYGALQSLLLTPTAAVADRVGRILGRSRCDVGVHLRKADGAEGPSAHWVAKLRAVLVPGATAFVAADPQSTLTKKLILASFPAVRFLDRDADAEATRSTVDARVRESPCGARAHPCPAPGPQHSGTARVRASDPMLPSGPQPYNAARVHDKGERAYNPRRYAPRRDSPDFPGRSAAPLLLRLLPRLLLLRGLLLALLLLLRELLRALLLLLRELRGLLLER
mgnify:CR=1 FL=1